MYSIIDNMMQVFLKNECEIKKKKKVLKLKWTWIFAQTDANVTQFFLIKNVFSSNRNYAINPTFF